MKLTARVSSIATFAVLSSTESSALFACFFRRNSLPDPDCGRSRREKLHVEDVPRSPGYKPCFIWLERLSERLCWTPIYCGKGDANTGPDGGGYARRFITQAGNYSRHTATTSANLPKPVGFHVVVWHSLRTKIR
jgi:hypothetical protein